jgi:hypothetical protein
MTHTECLCCRSEVPYAPIGLAFSTLLVPVAFLPTTMGSVAGVFRFLLGAVSTRLGIILPKAARRGSRPILALWRFAEETSGLGTVVGLHEDALMAGPFRPHALGPAVADEDETAGL